MSIKSIYELELHEEIQIPKSYMWVRRVAGGWIYSEYGETAGDMVTSAFVPYHNEFRWE